jgi:hypothetical protein
MRRFANRRVGTVSPSATIRMVIQSYVRCSTARTGPPFLFYTHSPARITGSTLPAALTPSTSMQFDPIIQST